MASVYPSVGMESRRDGRQVQSVLKGLSDGQSTGFMVQMMDQYQTARRSTDYVPLIVFVLYVTLLC